LSLGTDICGENLSNILTYASERHIFVRVDMEDSSTVDRTLGLWRQMRSAGFRNTGVVIQSYLHRSAVDVDEILREGGSIRLCKGAYKEPVSTAIQKKSDVDNNYDLLGEKLIEGALAHGSPLVSLDGKTPPIPAIATHDPNRIRHAMLHAENTGLPKNALEFQMLYGIRQDLQEQCVAAGYPVRIYVPYGTEWYPFYVRRLAERPANMWFFVSNFFRK
jgi:proline dehydrogenase